MAIIHFAGILQAGGDMIDFTNWWLELDTEDVVNTENVLLSVSVHLVVLPYLSTLSHSWTPFRAAFEALRRWGKWP